LKCRSLNSQKQWKYSNWYYNLTILQKRRVAWRPRQKWDFIWLKGSYRDRELEEREEVAGEVESEEEDL
jgi:hypothetical protein